MNRKMIGQSARFSGALARTVMVATGILVAGCLVSVPASAKSHDQRVSGHASHTSASTDMSARRFHRGYRRYGYYRPYRRYGFYRPYRAYGVYRPYYRPYYRRAYYPYYRPYYRPYYASYGYPYGGYGYGGYGYGRPAFSIGFGRGFGFGYGFGPRFGFGF